MQLKHVKTVIPAQDGPAKIMAIAWSPNNVKMAVCTADRVIVLFDDKGERRDRFPTKPSDAKNGRKSYVVKGLAFSPDSTKLAVAQSDKMIYVYRLGEDWGDKKVICNKFALQSPPTSLVWLTEGPLVHGQADGKLRASHVKSNKSQTLFATSSFVVSLAANVRGSGFLSGHVDGTIIRYFLTEEGSGVEKQGRVVTHPVPPYGLAWAAGYVLAAGCDRRVTVYTGAGQVVRQFDYGAEKEFTVACCSPSGQSVAVGSHDRVRVFSYSPRSDAWKEEAEKEVPDLYTVTALAWKRDGSRVACGALCGTVDLFESVLKRTVWKDKFEMTYVGPSQVLVRSLKSDSRGVILKSQFGHEIDDVKIMGQDRYLVARTPDTLLLGDLVRNLLSEVPWPDADRHERFYFDNPNVCLIFNCGELSLIEYGTNEILGSVRTELMNPHLISVRINERKQLTSNEDNKKLAYLLDLKTVCIVDLVYAISLLQVAHDSKIDWLELNETGHKLLYRDKKMRLTLLDTRSAEKHAILSYCTFVQWVPGSDVVVAQSRNNACIWYNIDAPDRVSTFPVRGEIVEVLRADGKTEILTQDGTHQLAYELDEGLVEFGTAVHDSDFGRAILFLEALGKGGDAEGMWQNLAEISLQLGNLPVAERCYAALGDMSRTHYLNETLKIAHHFVKTNGGNYTECPEVWARMAIINKKLKAAEAIYLDQNQLQKAIDMYTTLHKWDEAVALAESRGYSGLRELKTRHLRWLTETRQEDKAAELKETEGDHLSAISMYLKGNAPSRAAKLVQKVPALLADDGLVSRVVAALLKAEQYGQAGQMYEAVNKSEKALECYMRGYSFAKAIELARQVCPKEVITLEEEWGDYLTANKQLDAAISHYIEAGKTLKALDASLGSRQWKKAVQIIRVIDDAASVSKQYSQLGRHFADNKDFTLAEHLFTKAGLIREAIEMYVKAGEWDKAHYLATLHLESEQVAEMFLQQGRSLEASGKLKEAERLYVSVDQPDAAIAMYKTHRQYDQMMRLVRQYHTDLVQTTLQHLGQQLEGEGDLRAAESHYLAADQWKLAVNMYRSQNAWEDAYRVAQAGGGGHASLQVAFLWAQHLGADSAVRLLAKLGLLEACVDYAADTYQFQFAFELAKSGAPAKLTDVHNKCAMVLEDDGKFAEAEEQFVKAGKPKEAVMMYTHGQDWDNAERVAKDCDEETLAQVLVAQAKQAFHNKDYQLFESLLLRAHQPDRIVGQYREAGLWVDALRVCREYQPSRLAGLQAEYEREVGSRATRDVSSVLSQARQWQQSGEYKTAVDCYLRVNGNNCRDAETVAKALMEAAKLVGDHLQGEEGQAAARALGPRLVEANRHALAAQTYLAVDLTREAVDAFATADEWSKARQVAKEFDPELEPYVEDRYKAWLKEQGRAEQLADVDIVSALDLMCERGQWAKCLETAKPYGAHLLHKYAALYATQLIKEGGAERALNLYAKLGAPAYPQNYNIYRRIATDVMASPAESYGVWSHLRNVLFGLTEKMAEGSDVGSATHYEFSTLLLVSHFCALRLVLRALPSTSGLVADISASLLRHSDMIPADRAYYEAGRDAREAGRGAEAFVFLNHYLDVAEATEEGNPDALDHSDLAATDFPQEVPLPGSLFLDPLGHEQVKEWVLAVSMDQSVDQTLPLDERGLYRAALAAPDSASAPAPVCLVSGLPALGGPSRVLTFRRPGFVAIRENWNKLTMAARMHQTNAELQDVIKFVSEWCGPLPSFSF